MMKNSSWLIGVFGLVVAGIASIIWNEAIYQFGSKLAYWFWRIHLVFKAMDQRLIWALFSTVVFCVFGFRILVLIKDLFPKKIAEKKNERQSNLENWISLYQAVVSERKNAFARWILAESLFSLYAKIISEQEGINQQQLKKKMDHGEMDLPTDIRRFLQAGYMPFSKIENRWFAWKKNAYPALDVAPEKVVKHLEDLYGNDR